MVDESEIVDEVEHLGRTGAELLAGRSEVLAFAGAEAVEWIALAEGVEVRRLHLGGVGFERGEFRRDRLGVGRLGVVRLVGLEQEERVGAVMREAVGSAELVAEEVRVPRRDDGVDLASASSTRASAARSYSSTWTGDSDSASATLSKPLVTLSGGNSSAGRSPTASRSRTVLLYSSRLSRCSGSATTSVRGNCVSS